jgi:hypothetical protein
MKEKGAVVTFIDEFVTPTARRAAWNFFWMVVCRAVAQAALVGMVLVLTRHLSRADFGMFMTALAIQGHVFSGGACCRNSRFSLAGPVFYQEP